MKKKSPSKPVKSKGYGGKTNEDMLELGRSMAMAKADGKPYPGGPVKKK